MSNKSRRFLGVPDEFWMGFVIVVGFFLKLVYDIQIGYTEQTFNAGVWQEMVDGIPNEGQIGIIQYYFTMHKMPDFSLTEYPGFSSPPLYYWICAGILEIIHRLMGWAIGTSLHTIQCLNVFFVLIGCCCGVGMLAKFGVRRRKLTVAILFLTFFPMFYYLGASLSPDALCFMFTMLALNTALSWYESRRSSAFLQMGFWLGLGIMTSWYALMALPAVFALYYYAKKDGRRNETPLGVQLRRSLIIIILLGGWWPVFRMIRYHVSPFYIDAVHNGSYIGEISAIGRFLIPGAASLKHIHTVGYVSYESNFWGQLFKTAVFQFTGIETVVSETAAIANFALRLSIAICILMHIMWFYVLQTPRLDKPLKRFLVIGYLSTLGMYAFVAIRIPYVETVNLIKIAPVIMYPLIGMSVCGYGSGNENLFEKITTWLMNGMILILALVTAFLMGFYP